MEKFTTLTGDRRAADAREHRHRCDHRADLHALALDRPRRRSCSRTGATIRTAPKCRTSCSTSRAIARAQILMAGANFGCGSSREGAVWALHALRHPLRDRAELRRNLLQQCLPERAASGDARRRRRRRRLADAVAAAPEPIVTVDLVRCIVAVARRRRSSVRRWPRTGACRCSKGSTRRRLILRHEKRDRCLPGVRCARAAVGVSSQGWPMPRLTGHRRGQREPCKNYPAHKPDELSKGAHRMRGAMKIRN